MIKYILFSAILLQLISSCNPTNDTPIEQKQYVDNKSWIGDWLRESHLSDATLTIESIANDTITFSIMAFSGAHHGSVEGQAIIKGDTGYFYQNDDDNNCIIEFLIKGDSVIFVNQKEGLCYAGLGVMYSGKYINSKYVKKAPEKKSDLVTLAVLDSYHQDSVFKQLVGIDYESFVKSTQLTHEVSDLDSLNAKVSAAGVRGMFTFMENIVMIDSNDNIWAAVIDDQSILYFTNRPDFARKLPKTIDNWRKKFSDYAIVYKSNP